MKPRRILMLYNMGKVKKAIGPYFATNYTYPATEDSGGPYPSTTFTYDLRKRVTEIDRGSDVVFDIAYDGLEKTITDPDGRVKIEEKDILGRIKYTKNDASADYSYDAAGRLLEIVSTGDTTTIEYNDLGQKTSMTDPDIGYWTYEYDTEGNLVLQTDAREVETVFVYDDLNRVTSKSFSDSTPTVSNTYDTGCDTTDGGAIGRLCSQTNGDVSTTYGYDTMGRVKLLTKTITGVSARTTSTVYYLDGKLKSISYPGSGPTVNYDYHSSSGHGTNLVKDVYDGMTTFASFSNYETTGKIGTITYGNDVDTDYVYDGVTQRLGSIITTSGSTSIQDLAYTYTDGRQYQFNNGWWRNRDDVRLSIRNHHRLETESVNSANTMNLDYYNNRNIRNQDNSGQLL